MRSLLILAVIALLSTPAAARSHFELLGLKWGKTPADARAILANKLTFIDETPAKDMPYHTIDQRYKGKFGGLDATEVRLRFYKGEFFYMAVTLKAQGLGDASRVFAAVSRKMNRAYGAPDKKTSPAKLASGQAIVDNMPAAEAATNPVTGSALELLWNDVKEQSEPATYRMHDTQIRTGLWDPFVGWKFENDVKIQAFIQAQTVPGNPQGILVPYWIFYKDSILKTWRGQAQLAETVRPRDF
jgi:hypothetical protein